jgi:carboxyl-terminal processing protease
MKLSKKMRNALLGISTIAFLGGTLNISTSLAKDGEGKSRFEKLEIFNKVLYLIESQYYRPVDTEKLIEGAIKGMMNTLDPHSTFLDEKVFSKMQEDTQGEFGGLGIEVSQKDGVLVVITPIDDTPAFKAGIKSGDKIVEINHESTLGLTLEEAVDKMRGKPGSKITVGIAREGNDGIKRYELVRKAIKISAVKHEIIDDNYAYVRLTQFQKDAGDGIAKALKAMEKKTKNGIKGIILDLRSNPGGLLDEAVNVSSVFLRDGIVVSTEARDPKQKDIRYVKKTGFKELDKPLAVLINGASASASEIVAGALQDHERAIIMGSQSFGKGSVQSIAKIDDTQGVKLTIAQYMTPKDRKIQAVGIKPDIYISEYEGSWVTEHERESRYVREADLRNHLTATIETKEEKAERLKKEKEDRQNRIARIKELREKEKKGKNKGKDKDKESEDTITGPAEDFQVISAVKYLKAFPLIEKMTRE